MSARQIISTGGVARACARRPWITIGIWLFISVLAVLSISLFLGGALTSEMTFTRAPESQQGQKLLEQRLEGPVKIEEAVVVSSQRFTVDDPAFMQQVQTTTQNISALGPGVVESLFNYYLVHNESMVSKDRHTTIMPMVMAGNLNTSETNVTKLRDAMERSSGNGDFQVLSTGGATVNQDFNQLSQKDLQKAEVFGIPIAVIILVIVFGTLVAVGLPLVLAAFSILIAVGITAVVAHQFEMSLFVVNMIMMMGLAVGIDYSLFVVSRYREELLNGREKLDAIYKAGSTASRAVLFSGMTVIVALAGLLIVPSSLFYSLAAGAIFVVFVSVAAALTLLPAILRLMGTRINSLKVPFVHRYGSQRGNGEGRGFWNTTTRIVMKHPFISAVLATAVLLAPATQYFSIHTGANGIAAVPDSFGSKQGFLVLQREFSFGLLAPIKVVIDGDVNSPAVKEAVTKLTGKVMDDKAFYGAPQFKANDAGDLAVITMPVAGSPDSDSATGAVTTLRQDYVPAAFSGTGVRVYVAGQPAFNLDYFHITDDYRPVVFVFVLGLSFLLLMTVFRSIVVPLKAIIMNLLSVGAAYGLIVLVFQKGVGNQLFGFAQVESVEAWIPLFLFSVLFGLSMDYHVFLLGRIREHYMETGDNSESVAFGLRSTGSIITGAALIMVAVFAGFASGQLVMFQQMGFGLAVAVLLDATIVRSILVPSTMKLLGDRNWYLPRWLNWLPDVHVEGTVVDRENPEDTVILASTPDL